MNDRTSNQPKSDFTVLDTAGGPAYFRIGDVQAIVPTGINQSSIVLRGGAALGLGQSAKEAAGAFGLATPATPKLQLVGGDDAPVSAARRPAPVL